MTHMKFLMTDALEKVQEVMTEDEFILKIERSSPMSYDFEIMNEVTGEKRGLTAYAGTTTMLKRIEK